ncbi:MAG: GNAT family N-acetyltransferase [Bacteroidetes bacterium]|nr:MAG: GNAT family N-acetyltransferase [Bacteroidota bacterium]
MSENYQVLFEWIGYTGSVIIAISLMMSSIIKLRWLNLLGASIFSIYGFIIGAMPVAFLNLFITLINVFHLYGIYKQKDFLKILHIRTENKYLDFFIEFYQQDINKFFPGFYESFKNKLFEPESYLCFLIIRNAAVAGVFIGKKNTENEMFIEIDFAIPEYRDLKTGKYIYKQNLRYFENLGIKRLYADPKNRKHYSYLKKMGFSEKTTQDGKVLLMKDVD